MNVLILVSSLSYGGAEKQAVIDANLLSEKNNVILCSFFHGPLESQIAGTVKYIHIAKKNYFSTAKKIASITIENKVDLIQCSLFAPMIIGGLSSLLHKKPVIWTFHSHNYTIPLKSQLILLLMARLGKVRSLLFVNNELKDYYLWRYRFPERKTGIIYNSSQFQVKDINQKHIKSFISIGYVGRIIELKRINYLIELAAFLKEKDLKFQITIVGDGDQLEKMKELTKSKQLNDYIKYEGFQQDTRKYYHSFDIFINPSREECLSLALIDAGMFGIPSVAFDVGGNNEIIINNETGYIVDSKNEMFQKVETLITDNRTRELFGLESKKHCEANFSKAKHRETLELLYCSFV